MNDENISEVRQRLLSLLQGHGAHMSFEEAIKDFPEAEMNTFFPNGTYSSWHLLEHIRIAQRDILDYIVDPNYKELRWPDDYWPPKEKMATRNEWNTTISDYIHDRQTLESLVNNPTYDLFAPITNSKEVNTFKEILLVADHTAYHVGEFCIIRQVMGTWGEKR